jgi:excisionase family DNA binding protein
MSNHSREETKGPSLYYSVATLANRLDVSEDTVRRWIRTGALRSLRLGSNVRVDAIELEAFLRRQASETTGRRSP